MVRGYRCAAPGLVFRSLPPRSSDPGLVGHSAFFDSPSRGFLDFASRSALPPYLTRQGSFRSGLDILLSAEVPAVAVGPGPVQRRYIMQCRSFHRILPPRQPGGRVLISSTSPGPTLVLARARFAMSKSRRADPAGRPEVMHIPCQPLPMQRLTAFRKPTRW